MATTRSEISSVDDVALYVGLELSKKEWVLGISAGFGREVWVRKVGSGDWAAIDRVLGQARARFGVGATAPVHSCYEAGRDGFWVHWAVSARGWHNRVVDSSSIEVDRRKRRTKTDRIDARKLATMLVRVCAGERGVWREVRVPAAAVEAARQVSRERSALVEEQTRLRNQMGSWVATCGCRVSGKARARAGWWTTARDWQGAPLAATLQARLARAHTRLMVVSEQIATLDQDQARAVAAAPAESGLKRLVRVKGVATTSASIVLDEGLLWREFRNRREVGGLLGFAPAPYASGETQRDQGISRAGNARLQAVSIQLAWSWVRWQPKSALTVWYRARFGEGRRARRIGIVALARKLLISLWQYARTGVPPTGAVLKAA